MQRPLRSIQRLGEEKTRGGEGGGEGGEEKGGLHSHVIATSELGHSILAEPSPRMNTAAELSVEPQLGTA